jgi:hypothetical protein
MGISQGVDSVRTGVCTSTTRPASPYDGQVIYETDTDRAMVYNGTGWVVLSTGRANPGGLDLVYSGSFTLQTSASLPTNTFTSTYRNYKVIIDISATTSRSAIKLRFRTAGTDNTSADYYQAINGFTTENNTSTLAEAGTTSLTVATNYAQSPIIVNLDVLRPQLSLRTYGTGFYTSDNSAGANLQTRPTSFAYNPSTSFDSMTVFSDVANSMTGLFRVYGYADS